MPRDLIGILKELEKEGIKIASLAYYKLENCSFSSFPSPSRTEAGETRPFTPKLTVNGDPNKLIGQHLKEGIKPTILSIIMYEGDDAIPENPLRNYFLSVDLKKKILKFPFKHSRSYKPHYQKIAGVFQGWAIIYTDDPIF